MGQFNPRQILETLENPPTKIHTEKQTRQEDTGYEQQVYANNRTIEEEGKIDHKTETQNRRLETPILHNHQHCLGTMAQTERRWP